MHSFILIAVFVNCVFSDESDTNVKVRYNFNHPPSIESYNPIPVAVVYEDNGNRGRSNDPEDTPTEYTTENDDIQITTNAPLKVNLVSTKSDPEPSTEPQTIDYFQQIPVKVIYDTEPPILYKPTTTTSKTIKPLRRRLKQRRLLTPKSTTQKQSVEVTTESIKTEAPAKTSKPIVSAIPNTVKATRQRDPVVPIVESENQVYSHNGNFRYSYEGGDGTRAFSEGQLKQIDDDVGEAVVGGFSYTDKEGNDFSLSYTADENGYRPVGAHLPTPPPIPPAIARALAYLATATTPKPVTKPYDD